MKPSAAPPPVEERGVFAKLQRRRQTGRERTLPSVQPPTDGKLLDFCSNDYLGVVSQNLLANALAAHGDWESQGLTSGATGSRLLSGNSSFHETLEQTAASFHSAPAALLFNSGYCANLGLLSAVTSSADAVIYDSRIHASLKDGLKLSGAQGFAFRHNDLDHLEWRLKRLKSKAPFVLTESINSMSGATLDVARTADLCHRYGARLVVDEAHSCGVIGPDGKGAVVAAGCEQAVFARTVTFGKAFGAQGAVVLAAPETVALMVNFAHSFVYSTAMPPWQVSLLLAAYELLPSLGPQRQQLERHIQCFCRAMAQMPLDHLTDSKTAIQPIKAAPEQLIAAEGYLQQRGIDVRKILSPTVRKGEEQLRVILHAHNTDAELKTLCQQLEVALWQA